MLNVKLARRAFGAALLLAACAAPGACLAQDTMFLEGFEDADRPESDAEAARFLTQATYGPTTADIASVRSLGYSAWITQQQGVAQTFARPHMEAISAASGSIDHNVRLDRFYHTAATGPDQLRQRMAFAMSQIFVISDADGTLNGESIQVTEYWDLLGRNAFGNFRTLLGEVTFNPSMGKYLSHFRNRAETATSQPDENYAREVMQLFTIGLIKRNLDFTPLLDGMSQTQPTYDQTVITNLAKVFTGFAYNNASPTNINSGTNTYLPMSCLNGVFHDTTQKTLFDGMVISAGGTCSQDVNAALDLLYNHPNVAPFIARQLIQRFVTSNPSFDYIERVATVFENDGTGERGDLGATLRAVLLDPEARNDYGAPADFGKVREPVLKLTAMWRAFDAQMQPADAFGRVPMTGFDVRSQFTQRPLGAPTVFNFYEPDYQQPGPLQDAGLYSPEMQILNESSIVGVGNILNTYSYNNSFVGATPQATTRPLLNITALAALSPDYPAMVEYANQRLLYGRMSTGLRNALLTMLPSINAGTYSANVERARSLIYITAISPDYATQR